MDERLAGLFMPLQRKEIAAHTAARIVAPPHLLAAWPGRLVLRALASRQSGVFLHLVNAVGGRRIRRCGEACADADTVDRRVGAREGEKGILIESATGKDRRFLEAAAVENVAHAFGERDKVAGIEAHAADRDTGRF